MSGHSTTKDLFYWPASLGKSVKYFTYPLMVGVLLWWANGFSVKEKTKVIAIGVMALIVQELSSENRVVVNKMHSNNQQLMFGLFRNVERQSGYFKPPEKTA